MKYKIYNRLYFKKTGKPAGTKRKFLAGIVTAKNKDAAMRKMQRNYNVPWSKKDKTLMAKVVEAKKVMLRKR